jgi:hypothetical protein
MSKKFFKMTSKANKELRWYDDTRANQFIVYSPYFVYSFIDKQDAIESGCDLSNLEFRNISDVINAFSRECITSGDILKGFMKANAEPRQATAMQFKLNANNHLCNIYKGKDARHTVVVREEYLPKDTEKYYYTNVCDYKTPVVIQDKIYDCRWAYVLPVNSLSDIEKYFKFD